MEKKSKLILLASIPLISLIILIISIYTPYWFNVEQENGDRRSESDFGLFKIEYRSQYINNEGKAIVNEEDIVYSEFATNDPYYDDIRDCTFLTFYLVLLGALIYSILMVMIIVKFFKQGEKKKSSNLRINLPIIIYAIVLILIGAVLNFSLRFPSLIHSGRYASSNFGISWVLLIIGISLIIFDAALKYFTWDVYFGSVENSVKGPPPPSTDMS